MLLKGILAAGFMLIALVVTIGVIGPVNEQVEAARTQNATATNLACTTGSSDTTCNITLPTQSQYSYLGNFTNASGTLVSGGTVEQTSPTSADKTAASTIATDRVTITVSGLASSTSFLFTVNYLELASGVDQNTSNIMQYIPLLLVLGAVFVAMLWLLSALKVIR